jgi:hypothetical protein
VEIGQKTATSIAKLLDEVAQAQRDTLMARIFACAAAKLQCTVEEKAREEFESSAELWNKSAKAFRALAGLYGKLGNLADPKVYDQVGTAASEASKAFATFQATASGQPTKADVSNLAGMIAKDLTEAVANTDIKMANEKFIEIVGNLQQMLNKQSHDAEVVYTDRQDRMSAVAKDLLQTGWASPKPLFDKFLLGITLDWANPKFAVCDLDKSLQNQSSDCRGMAGAYELINQNLNREKHDSDEAFNAAIGALGDLQDAHQNLGKDTSSKHAASIANLARLSDYVDELTKLRKATLTNPKE